MVLEKVPVVWDEDRIDGLGWASDGLAVDLNVL